jgi:hypothetical protein
MASARCHQTLTLRDPHRYQDGAHPLVFRAGRPYPLYMAKTVRPEPVRRLEELAKRLLSVPKLSVPRPEIDKEQAHRKAKPRPKKW